MRRTVSRGTAAYDDRGRKLCSRCKQRLPKKGQRYCQPCLTDYMRDWRQKGQAKGRQRRDGMVEALLTADEWAAVQQLRDKNQGEI